MALPAFHVGILVCVLAVPSPVQLPPNLPGKVMVDGLDIYTPAALLGDMDEFLDSDCWLQTDSNPGLSRHQRLKQQIEDFFYVSLMLCLLNEYFIYSIMYTLCHNITSQHTCVTI